ncbi:MAG TPA: HEAT repeat domain-containing protein [Terriglobia bacterium]|nr:HEAT repeat domain-containing protein [Terriglobia bacterium]
MERQSDCNSNPEKGARLEGRGRQLGERHPQSSRGLRALRQLLTAAALLGLMAGGRPVGLRAQAQPSTAPPGPHFPRPNQPALPGDRRLMLPARGRIGLQRPVPPARGRIGLQRPVPPGTPQGQQQNSAPAPQVYSPVKPAPPAVVVAPGSSAGVAGPTLHVDYAAGLLSVTADKVQLSQVLQQVGQRTGIEVRGLQEVSQAVSIHFSGVPVAQGVRDLLGGSNYVVFGSLASAADAKQARVILLSAATGAQVDVGPPAAPAASPTAPEERESLRAALMSANPVEQDSGFTRLQKLSPREAYDELENVIVNGDGVARLRALQYLEQDGQLDSNLVLGSLRDALNDPDSSLRDYSIQALGRINGPEALDLLRQELSQSDPAVRLNVVEALSQRDDGHALIQQAAQDPDQAVAGLASELLRSLDAQPQPGQPGEVQPQPVQPETPPDAEPPAADPDPPTH